MADKSLDILVRILTEQVGEQKAGEVLGEYKKQTEGTAEATEKLNKHMEGGRALFSEVNKIVPGLGEAMRAAFEGPLGPVIMLGVAVHTVLDGIKEYNEELSKEGEEAYQPHLDSLKNLQDAWDEAADHMAQYHVKLASAGEDENPLETELKRIGELRDAQIDANKKIIESNLELEQSDIRTKGEKAGLSNNQIEGLVKQAKDRADAAIQALDDQKRTGKIQDEQAELEKAKNNLPTDSAAADAANRAYDAANRKHKDDDDERDRLRLSTQDIATPEGYDKLPDNDPRKKIFRAGQQLSGALAEPSSYVGPNGAIFDNSGQKAGDVAAAQEALAAAQAELDAQKTRLNQLETSQRQRDEALKTAEENRDLAERRATQDKDVVGRNPGDIDQKQKLEGITEAGQKSVVAGQVGGKELTAAIQEAQAALNGTASAGQIQDILSIGRQIAGHAVNLGEAVSIINQAANNHMQFMRDVGRLATALQRLPIEQVRDIGKRVDDLEARLNAAH